MHRKPTTCSSKSRFLLIFMASICLLAFFSVLSFISISSAHHHHHFPKPGSGSPSFAGVPPEIHQACSATRFPDICESSLTRVPANPNPLQIVQSALSVSNDNLKTAQTMVKAILISSAGNRNRTTAAKNCMEVLANSVYRTQSAAAALPGGKIKDVRAWTSAALLFQYDCWSSLKYANDTQQVNQTMSFLDSLTKLTSNALSLMVSYDVFGPKTASWKPPTTERTGFWEAAGPAGSGLGSTGGVPKGLKADATVCKSGGGGCYKTVQEAVNAAPSNSGRRFVISIKEGVYEEMVRIPLEKPNVVFLGDGIGKTVITGSANVGQPGVSTYNTATVGVSGDGFMASGITFKNTAGPDAHQAVAFRSDSDLSVIENCEFLGNQDTLYAHSLRQFYKSCRIQGNVDFIFGNSATVFQDCTILVAPRQVKPEKGENNAVTAQGRTDPAQSTGFVFINSVINGTEEYLALYRKNPKVHKNFLGRPWKEYSRTVFIQCALDAIVSRLGWLPWDAHFALATLYYGEYGNSGPGAGLTGRVTWSSRIPAEHINAYSVKNFIQGDLWIPSS